MREIKSVQWGISHDFFAFRATSVTFRISQHFAPGSTIERKLQGFHGLFFRGINKTQNSPEMQKVYSECFSFCDVFLKNIREIQKSI